MPRLKDSGAEISFLASDQAVLSAGPNLPQCEAHIVEGKVGGPSVTLELQSPRGEEAVEVYAAAHVASGNPPKAEVKYQIDISTDGGKTWKSAVKDWTLARQGEEPSDFWSQSIYWGKYKLAGETGPIRIRFSNSHKRAILRAEAHLVYKVKGKDDTKVTFSWKEAGGAKEESHTFAVGDKAAWKVPTGKNVQTKWVEFETVGAK